MKKITRIFALALALVMAFALQAPVNAAEKAAVNQEKAQATGQRNGSYDDDDRCHKSELCTIL